MHAEQAGDLGDAQLAVGGQQLQDGQRTIDRLAPTAADAVDPALPSDGRCLGWPARCRCGDRCRRGGSDMSGA